MRTLLITLIIGIVVGMIDILPMLKMKLDKYAISSAFLFYFILPFIILNIDLFGLVWWLKGAIIGFILALPVIIIVSKSDKKSVPPMVIMSVILGSVIGIAGHLLKIS